MTRETEFSRRIREKVNARQLFQSVRKCWDCGDEFAQYAGVECDEYFCAECSPRQPVNYKLMSDYEFGYCVNPQGIVRYSRWDGQRKQWVVSNQPPVKTAAAAARRERRAKAKDKGGGAASPAIEAFARSAFMKAYQDKDPWQGFIQN